MFLIGLGLLLCMALVFIASKQERGVMFGPLGKLMLAGFLARLVIHPISRGVVLFSRGVWGGDNGKYEWAAWLITKVWDATYVHYVTPEEVPALNHATLQCNIFALVIYLNGGERTPLGCTMVVAFIAVLACYHVYTLAVEHGATVRDALIVSGILMFLPGYLYHTIDTYKDGFVIFLSVGAFACAVRVAKRFSVPLMLMSIAYMFALYFVRFYLVIIGALPILVAAIGFGTKNIARQVIGTIASLLFLGLLLVATPLLQTIAATAEQTFEAAEDMRIGNARGGSGVEFDDGGNPFASLGPKLLYTIFSPFPWEMGRTGSPSIGLQLGKFDALIWYYIVYRAWFGAKRLWARQRQFVLMLLCFAGPTLLAYALTMSNIGLILRQRLPVVMVVGVMAAVGWRKNPEESEAAEPAVLPEGSAAPR